MRDRGEVKHRIALHHAVIADIFAERTFRLDMPGRIEIALEHVFGIGRHENIVGHALHHRHRRTAHGADDVELVDVRQRAHGGQKIRRMRADRVGDRHLLLARRGIEIDRAHVARRDQVDAGLARPAQHDAAATHIGEAGVGKQRVVDARGDVRRAVGAVLQMRRQRAQVRLVALEHDLLHRRLLRRHFRRRQRLRQPLLQRAEQAALVGIERKRQPPTRTHDVADKLGLLRSGGLEQRCLWIAVEHRGHIDEIDRLVVHLAFAELHQPVDEIAQPEAFGIDGRHFWTLAL